MDDVDEFGCELSDTVYVNGTVYDPIAVDEAVGVEIRARSSVDSSTDS